MREAIKRLLNIFGIFALAILLFSCPDEPVQNQENKAMVSFSVTDARTVLPQLSLENVASYKLLGGLNGEAETELAEFTPGGTIISLDPGMWNFTLNAYNEDGDHLLQGIIQNKQIKLTGINQVVFSLSGVSTGTGTIEITLNFPTSAGITRIVAKSGADTEEFTISAISGRFVYTNNEIAAGDYFLNFELYRGNRLQAVVSELVVVRNNFTSRKTITLVGADLKPLLTGTVNITGTAWVGATLTANTGTFNGTGDISYQWNRVITGVSTAIPDANNSIYTMQVADVGYTITVTVTRDGYAGDITSSQTAIVIIPPLAGTVSITGNAWVGQTLTANAGTLNGTGSINYQWNKNRDAIPGANNSTYTLQADDVGYTITVTVTRDGYDGDIISSPTAIVILPPLTGTVSISGNVQIGQTLTANTDSLNGNGTISYQWKRVRTGYPPADIGTDSTYVVQAADAGYTITVTVTRADNSGSVTSSATGLIVIFSSVTADGSSSQFTTALTLTFSQTIPELSADDITITHSVSGQSVNKGRLSRIGSDYTLPIDGFTAGGTLNVSVAKSGYAISDSEKTVTIHVVSVTLNSVTADGSDSQFTKNLTLTFSQAILGLSADDITITHSVSGQIVSKGTISETGPVYTLPISGFTAGGTLTVSVKKSGYTISGSQTATIHVISVTLDSVTQNGSSSQGTSTLTLTFSQEIPGFSAGDITLSHSVPGQSVSKATLIDPNEFGPDTYTLMIHGFTSNGTLTVSAAKSGYEISGLHTMPIYSQLSGTVSINGNPWVGQTLAANTGSLNGSGTITYQWKRGETNISTNDSYTVQTADIGYTITVTVRRSNNVGSVTSPATATVTLPPLTGTVTINGTGIVGQTLTANTSNLGGSGTITYQWKDGTTNVGTGNTYTPDNIGSITVTVTRSGNSGSVTSNPITVIRPPLTGTVTITGSTWVGNTLTANTSNLGGSGTIYYNWQRVSAGETTTDVGSNSTYVIQAADADYTIRVSVSRSGNSGFVTSAPTATILRPGLYGYVDIEGIAKVGQTLIANTTDLAPGSGAFSYQWKRGETVIGTGNSYLVKAADEGYRITVTVTRSGWSGSVTSAPTAAVIP